MAQAVRLRRAHPFDVAYGLETSRLVGPRRIGAGEFAAFNVGYVGSQPSILRKVLRLIPGLEDSSFIDLGCGKGRACIVASEFPFRAVVGLEIGAELAAAAEASAERVRQKHPERPRITVERIDASQPDLPAEGQSVLFLYNSFGEPLVRRLVAHLEAQVRAGRKVFLIYYNPVAFDLFDASPAFSRFHAARHDFDPAEARCAPFDNTFDSVVVYQSSTEPRFEPHADAGRRVVVSVPGLGANVEM